MKHEKEEKVVKDRLKQIRFFRRVKENNFARKALQCMNTAILAREARTKRSRNKLLKVVQAKKSIWRMPWHWEPTKDVTSCDKLR